MTCSTASNSGKFAWSGVGIEEGTTLKGITFRLSDFFSIKGYSMNPVSLLPHLVHCFQNEYLNQMRENLRYMWKAGVNAEQNKRPLTF